jgi:dihydrofolate reductase
VTNYVYIGTSLDGYIADAEGGVDWLQVVTVPEGEDLGFAKFMSGIDAVIMGRVTFETLIGFGVGWHYGVPGIILSTTMTEVPPAFADHVSIASGAPAEIVELARSRGYENLYIDGGSTVQGFLRDDLIDELIISRLPVLLGEGVPLFGGFDKRLDLELVGSEVLLGQIVKSRYRRKRSRDR